MKNLSSYIKENNQVELIDYIEINEGLLNFFKKLWNWMFVSTKENKKDHKGKYMPYEFVEKEVKNTKPSTEKTIDYVLMQNNQFKKWMNNIARVNLKHPFYNAWLYHKTNVNDKIVCCTIKDVQTNKGDFLCVMFGKYNKKEFSLTFKNIFWNEMITKEEGINNEYKQAIFDLSKEKIKSLFNKKIKTVNIECKD